MSAVTPPTDRHPEDQLPDFRQSETAARAGWQCAIPAPLVWELEPYELTTYLRIAYFARKGGACTASVATLSEGPVDAEKIRQAIKSLARKNLVRIQRCHGETNKIWLQSKAVSDNNFIVLIRSEVVATLRPEELTIYARIVDKDRGSGSIKTNREIAGNLFGIRQCQNVIEKLKQMELIIAYNEDGQRVLSTDAFAFRAWLAHQDFAAASSEEVYLPTPTLNERNKDVYEHLRDDPHIVSLFAWLGFLPYADELYGLLRFDQPSIADCIAMKFPWAGSSEDIDCRIHRLEELGHILVDRTALLIFQRNLCEGMIDVLKEEWDDLCELARLCEMLRNKCWVRKSAPRRMPLPSSPVFMAARDANRRLMQEVRRGEALVRKSGTAWKMKADEIPPGMLVQLVREALKL